MKKVSCKIYILMVAIMLVLGLMQGAALASISLSINPIDGANNLQFGRVDIPSAFNKEVKIRITSSGAKQYQVFQRIVDPLVNERGEVLD